MPVSVYFTGLTMGLSLIVAIGAQNSFVLRQGLRNEHVFAVCLACALSDALLILAGVMGLRQATAMLPVLEPALRYGGGAFLIWYGVRSLLSALRSSAVLAAGAAGSTSLSASLATCAALTWLNPHVYLDTVLLIGSVASQFPGEELVFAAGAMTASFLFFFALGYGSRWLRPLFANPAAWRILDGVVAVTMWAIAFKLLRGG
ncbi:LysE/ArgO family amino acid transporter [Bosea sp. (in: a-proteobacteria)]|uniref:LysE/ArgO family amino acid transporter n=1 Tax=Bosea sp. (in: a-proteobacteria) TaxID=1871050 RepID=UPI002FC8F0CA